MSDNVLPSFLQLTSTVVASVPNLLLPVRRPMSSLFVSRCALMCVPACLSLKLAEPMLLVSVPSACRLLPVPPMSPLYCMSPRRVAVSFSLPFSPGSLSIMLLMPFSVHVSLSMSALHSMPCPLLFSLPLPSNIMPLSAVRIPAADMFM